MAHIDYFFATISPYTYLAGTRMEAIAARHGASLRYRPTDIIALFGRTGGLPPKDRHPSRQEYRLMDIERSARMLDVPINVKPAHWPTNPAPSSYAIIAAQDAVAKGAEGDLAGLVASFPRACWAEERDVADDAVIRDCLSAAGFETGLADSGMLLGAETFASNLEEAARRGVFGAPFYILDDGARFWGADRLDHLDAHLAGRL